EALAAALVRQAVDRAAVVLDRALVLAVEQVVVAQVVLGHPRVAGLPERLEQRERLLAVAGRVGAVCTEQPRAELEVEARQTARVAELLGDRLRLAQVLADPRVLADRVERVAQLDPEVNRGLARGAI